MNTGKLSAFLGESRALLAIAWPMVIAQLAQMGTGVVDTIMAGHYSSTDLAAIAIGYNIWLPLFLLVLGMMLAATAIVAQDYGAGRIQAIRDMLPQSLWLALFMGMIVGPLCYASGPLLDLLELDIMTRDKSLAYLQAVAFGMPGAALFQALRCHSQGIGIMRPFAVASVIAFLANIPLNYAFIYGKWGVPEMGAAGCGWATAISMWLGALLIYLYTTRAQALKAYLPTGGLVGPHWTTIREICRLGIPIGFTFFLEVAVFSVIGLMIATLGNSAMAAHQIAFNVWDVLYMPLISIGSAMATRIGHAIGANDRDAVNLSVSCGAVLALLMGLASMLLLLTGPDLIISAYTNDAEIYRLAVNLLRLAALFIIIDATREVASFGLRAFKDTRFPFIVTFVAYWLVTLPMGYWLGLVRADTALEGTAGFWKAMILGIGVSSIMVIWRLSRTLKRPLPSAQDGNAPVSR